MKRMWAVYAIVAAVLYAIVSTLYVAGSFKSINPRQAETVEVIRGIYGPEDMDMDEAKGRLYISSSNRWRTQRGLASADAIWVLDVDSSASPHRLATDFGAEFHPHGISFLRQDSMAWLLVVNHNAAGDFVEAFSIAGDTLHHIRSYSDKELCCPNDVVAVAPDKFYVTNDHGTTKGFWRTVEDYGRLPLSNVLYYNGENFIEACKGLQYGNGINISRDGNRLFVATTTGRELYSYQRDPVDGSLRLSDQLALKTGLDNIDIDADGNLWIAAHPKLLAFVGHAKDSNRRSPSQILKLTPSGESFLAEEVVMDDGSLLSGSSIAIHYKDQLFVGGVFQPTILRIRLDPNPH
jgi:arylesterase/paraoxonase